MVKHIPATGRELLYFWGRVSSLARFQFDVTNVEAPFVKIWTVDNPQRF